MKLTLIASVAMGLESVLKKEIMRLGNRITAVHDGRVEFEGDLTDICKANLWCRTAGRIFVKIGEFKAHTFDELFEQTQALPWEEWIGKQDVFPVSKISSRKSDLFSKSDCQAVVKKAVVKRLLKAHGASHLPESSPAVFAIRVQIESDLVVLSIDTSGEGLNKRGYREHMDIAPIRETLAAGMVLLSNWKPEKEALMDPLCGTGTLLIEAGLIAKNIAPGTYRSFASEQWTCIPKKLWTNARIEAKDMVKKNADVHIYGSDINHTALSVARKNIELAGVDDIVFVQNQNMRDLGSRFSRGKLITNPPYGERLGEIKDAEKLYVQLGEKVNEKLPDWHVYVITSHEKFEELYGKKSTKRRKLYNGKIKCCLYQYY